MNFSYADLLSVEDILADAILFSGDPEMRLLNKGFYIRQAKRGLDEMGFETMFDIRYQDIETPHDLRLPIPSGAWNIRDIFVFDTYLPTTEETNRCCQIVDSRRVFHKANYLSTGYANSYTARNKAGQWDSFVVPISSDASLLFYNVQNGMIMLSDACVDYQYIRIVYNGTPSDIDKTKMIPPFCRNAIVGYVVERAMFALKSRDKAYRIDWVDAQANLYTPKSRMSSSTWDEAKHRLKSMDKKQRDDLAEYLSRGSW